MPDDRDYAGMYEIEDGMYAQRVHIYENDAQMNGLRGQVTALDAKAAETNTRLTAVEAKLDAIKSVIEQMGFTAGGLKVKLI